jgi:hypothetical protein
MLVLRLLVAVVIVHLVEILFILLLVMEHSLPMVLVTLLTNFT